MSVREEPQICIYITPIVADLLSPETVGPPLVDSVQAKPGPGTPVQTPRDTATMAGLVALILFIVKNSGGPTKVLQLGFYFSI